MELAPVSILSSIHTIYGSFTSRSDNVNLTSLKKDDEKDQKESFTEREEEQSVDIATSLSLPFLDHYYYRHEKNIDNEIKEIIQFLKTPLEALKSSLSNNTVNSGVVKDFNRESINNASKNFTGLDRNSELETSVERNVTKKIDSYFLFHILDFILYLVDESLLLLEKDSNIDLNLFLNHRGENDSIPREFGKDFCTKSIKKRIVFERLFEEGRKEVFRLLNMGFCTDLSMKKPRQNLESYMDLIKSQCCYGSHINELERLDLDTTLEILCTRSETIGFTDKINISGRQSRRNIDNSTEVHDRVRGQHIEHIPLPSSLMLPSAHLYNYREYLHLIPHLNLSNIDEEQKPNENGNMKEDVGVQNRQGKEGGNEIQKDQSRQGFPSALLRTLLLQQKSPILDIVAIVGEGGDELDGQEGESSQEDTDTNKHRRIDTIDEKDEEENTSSILKSPKHRKKMKKDRKRSESWTEKKEVTDGGVCPPGYLKIQFSPNGTIANINRSRRRPTRSGGKKGFKNEKGERIDPEQALSDSGLKYMDDPDSLGKSPPPIYLCVSKEDGANYFRVPETDITAKYNPVNPFSKPGSLSSGDANVLSSRKQGNDIKSNYKEEKDLIEGKNSDSTFDDNKESNHSSSFVTGRSIPKATPYITDICVVLPDRGELVPTNYTPIYRYVGNTKTDTNTTTKTVTTKHKKKPSSKYEAKQNKSDRGVKRLKSCQEGDNVKNDQSREEDLKYHNDKITNIDESNKAAVFQANINIMNSIIRTIRGNGIYARVTPACTTTTYTTTSKTATTLKSFRKEDSSRETIENKQQNEENLEPNLTEVTTHTHTRTHTHTGNIMTTPFPNSAIPSKAKPNKAQTINSKFEEENFTNNLPVPMNFNLGTSGGERVWICVKKGYDSPITDLQVLFPPLRDTEADMSRSKSEPNSPSACICEWDHTIITHTQSGHTADLNSGNEEGEFALLAYKKLPTTLLLEGPSTKASFEHKGVEDLESWLEHRLQLWADQLIEPDVGKREYDSNNPAKIEKMLFRDIDGLNMDEIQTSMSFEGDNISKENRKDKNVKLKDESSLQRMQHVFFPNHAPTFIKLLLVPFYLAFTHSPLHTVYPHPSLYFVLNQLHIFTKANFWSKLTAIHKTLYMENIWYRRVKSVLLELVQGQDQNNFQKIHSALKIQPLPIFVGGQRYTAVRNFQHYMLEQLILLTNSRPPLITAYREAIEKGSFSFADGDQERRFHKRGSRFQTYIEGKKEDSDQHKIKTHWKRNTGSEIISYLNGYFLVVKIENEDENKNLKKICIYCLLQKYHGYHI